MNRSDSRSVILKRIRDALGDVTTADQSAQIDRNYRTRSPLSADQHIELFAERVGDYQADVKIAQNADVQKAIFGSLRSRNAKRVVIAPGLNEIVATGLNEEDNLSEEFSILKDEPVPLTNDQLDQCDAIVTTCFLAIAETGTIVLNSGKGQGRRALTLIPDFHICVVPAERIRGNVPEAIAELDKLVRVNPSPVTFISGPSATSDIELNRVEGVHGPRTLHVIISRT